MFVFMFELSAFILCITSKARRMLSVIDLLGTKADCSSEINRSSTYLSLLARVLEYILYNILHNEIGRRSLTNSGHSFFGIRIMVVSLTCYRTSLFSNHLWQVSTTSFPTTCQNFWKKAGFIPSRLGALLGCMWKSTYLIFSQCSGWRSCSFSSLVIYAVTPSTTWWHSPLEAENNSLK